MSMIDPGLMSSLFANVMERWGLGEWAARQFVLTGPAPEIVTRLAALIDAGARNFRVPITLAQPLAFARQVAEIMNAAAARVAARVGV